MIWSSRINILNLIRLLIWNAGPQVVREYIDNLIYQLALLSADLMLLLTHDAGMHNMSCSIFNLEISTNSSILVSIHCLVFLHAALLLVRLLCIYFGFLIFLISFDFLERIIISELLVVLKYRIVISLEQKHFDLLFVDVISNF